MACAGKPVVELQHARARAAPDKTIREAEDVEVVERKQTRRVCGLAGFDLFSRRRLTHGAPGSVPDDLHQPAAVALPVELDEEHALPGSELEVAIADRNRLARSPEQHRHAV